jgi:hypothetical protein
VVLVAACAVAGGVLAGLRLAKISPSVRHPASASSVVPFKDRDGQIVFEQQPSGLLGTAEPDGSHHVTDTKLSGLQGYDLPVGSRDGRYLVNLEGQLVTVGAHLPTAATQIAPPNPQAADQLGGVAEWMTPTFADGSKYLAVTECDPGVQAPFFQAWASWLIPTGGGKPSSLGLVTASAGIPGAAEAIAALPANPAAARQDPTCDGQQLADGSLAILSPGKAPHVILTAAALVKAAGWKASTPVILYPVPSPDGSELLVSVQEDIQVSGAAIQSGRIPTILAAWFLVSPAGRILSELPSLQATATFGLAWSPDGRQLATCHAVQGQQSSVTLLSVSGGRAAVTRTIPLPGRHDLACDQLLWSPDGTQLIYSAIATRGLTQADGLQHGWTIVDLATGKVHDVTAPGQPAAWLPAAGA